MNPQTEQRIETARLKVQHEGTRTWVSGIVSAISTLTAFGGALFAFSPELRGPDGTAAKVTTAVSAAIAVVSGFFSFRSRQNLDLANKELDSLYVQRAIEAGDGDATKNWSALMLEQRAKAAAAGTEPARHG